MTRTRKHVGYATHRAEIEAKAALLAPRVEHIRGRNGEPTYRFLVPSSSGGGSYEVDARGVPLPRLANLLRRAVCNCEAGLHNTRGCSHVTAVYLRWVWEYEQQGLDTPGADPSSLDAISRTLLGAEYLGGEQQTDLLVAYGQRVAQLRQLPTAEIVERLRGYKRLPERERSVLEQELRSRDGAERERIRSAMGMPEGGRQEWREEV